MLHQKKASHSQVPYICMKFDPINYHMLFYDHFLDSILWRLEKNHKHIIPNGGETWWFTMVESIKESP